MRFIRTRQTDGSVVHAVLEADGRARALPGAPWEGCEPIGASFTPGPLLAPVIPPAIMGIAQNYRAHAAEMGGKLSAHPVYFMKLPTNVQDPGEPIRLPRALRSEKVDYEGELAVVLGRTCRNVRAEDAMEAVLGFCIANDVTARDWQKEWGGGQFCRGKSFDTFCPLGPEIVTLDELANPFALDLNTRLNGEVVQASSTDDLIFDIPTLIAFLCGSTTLPAGTVILTGTPSGVGVARTPPRFLRAGDVVEIEIEGLGCLRNPVVEEAL